MYSGGCSGGYSGGYGGGYIVVDIVVDIGDIVIGVVSAEIDTRAGRECRNWQYARFRACIKNVQRWIDLFTWSLPTGRKNCHGCAKTNYRHRCQPLERGG
jgi:hypothetical protein